MNGMQPSSSDIDHLRWLASSGITSLSGLRVLDLGCGSGYICDKAIHDGATSAVGIDLVKPRCLEASSKWVFLDSNLDGDGWIKQIPGQEFDLVMAFDILEHLESPYRFLTAIKSILSKNGTLVLTTPNTLSWERFMKPASWSGAQDPQHKVLFNRYSLKFLLSRAGLNCSQMRAPMRSLAPLGPLQPEIGGQIICLASVK